MHDAVAVVRKKVTGSDDAGLERDHTLVQLTPNRKGCCAVWLPREKTLDFNELTASDRLEYRKRHQNMKFAMADGSSKTMVLDTSLPEIDLVNKIWKKLGVPHADEYCLSAEIQKDPLAWLKLEKPLSEHKQV